MTKVFTLALGALALATSCGVSTKAPKDNKDTAAYAIGVVIGESAMMRIDSTLDYQILIDGLEAAYGKDAAKKLAEAQAYMTALQFGQSAMQVDSTFDVSVIAAGIVDAFKKQQAFKADEANSMIMEYIASKQQNESTKYFETIDAIEGVAKNENGVRYKISAPGSQPLVATTDTAMVNYTLYGLKDEVLDSSNSRNEPLRVEPGSVVPGFAQGLLLLGKGGKATIWVPSELGYGERGSGSVAPNQPLKFEIEIVEIMPAKASK